MGVLRDKSRGVYNRHTLVMTQLHTMIMLLLVFQIRCFVLEVFVSVIYFTC